ncbi:hypothetical protein D9M68_875250 [compost metagenome]
MNELPRQCVVQPEMLPDRGDLFRRCLIAQDHLRRIPGRQAQEQKYEYGHKEHNWQGCQHAP